ncbi:methionine--tRNA ligase [Desulfonatronovibrio hydrogenovorans]|uniref:methionine--tRNA ligase n=1 Tax=Desulfonatronovibrio hydrogenovorans TaxID=53245 RepID=UPI00048B4C09|nr:methionine--tRNA ligase [Desulfonatronovibrio hydrogenovorans]
MNPFFISTPIYYVNAKPHLGHAYTTIVADSVNRIHKLQNKPTFFLTGTDEHGDKIVEAAAKNNQTPEEYVDRISALFRETWPGLEIQPDRFIRTTDPKHKKCVQDILQKVYDNGDIYFGEYGGHYCFGCERFYTDKELKDGLCPDHLEKPKFIQEKNYFFRMKKYLEPLREHIQNNPDFIRPERYRNEVLGMLGEELSDLCISRPKTRLTWGIELPFDQDYVTYVWFDALINYVSALDWPDGDDFKNYWSGAHHLVAKDILKPHAVFWPTMLMSAGIPLYKSLRVHGYWTIRETKMSKSLGNVVEPMAMKEKYGLSAFRYFLLREMQFGLDASFSEEALVGRLNADLANDLGNLTNRVLAMTHKYFKGQVPEAVEPDSRDRETMDLGVECFGDYVRLFENFEFAKALSRLWVFVSHLNKYVDQSAPWALFKEKETVRLQTVMYVLLEGLRKIALHLWPVMPGASEQIMEQLGQPFDLQVADLGAETSHWQGLVPGTLVARKSNLFPRVDLDQGAEKDLKDSQQGEQAREPEVSFEDFQRLKLVTGRVVKADKVKGADKLYLLLVDIGEDRPRQIVAGLADFYSPQDLENRQVVVLANLAPKKIRGVKSRGMVLAVRHGREMALLKADPETLPGNKVS